MFSVAFRRSISPLYGLQLLLYRLISDLVQNAYSVFLLCKPKNQTITKTKPNNNQTKTEKKPKENQSITKAKPNYNYNDNENVNLNDNDNLNENANENIISLSQKRFNQFWSLYPRKEGKGAARKAWEKINPNADLFQKIINAVQDNLDHNPQWQKQNGQFIPHPTTWLNQERWEDDIESISHEDWLTREIREQGGLTFE